MKEEYCKCEICSKEFEKKHHSQKYCSRDCAEKKVKIDYELERSSHKCEICGFDKLVHLHHIIKRQDYGSNNNENLIWLCPNHHEMADSIRYEKEIKTLIFEKTGKIGQMLIEEQIKLIEDEIAERVGGYEYKDHYCWHSTKMMLINAGMFYPLTRIFERRLIK